MRVMASKNEDFCSASCLLGPQGLEVFVVKTDHTLLHMSFSANARSSWERFGGAFQPRVKLYLGDRIDLMSGVGAGLEFPLVIASRKMRDKRSQGSNDLQNPHHLCD